MTAATRTPLRRPAPTTCPGPCAGLCGQDGLAAAHREHSARLLGMARAMLGDPALAEDVVQEVFLRAWAACSSFDPSTGPPLVSWLVTITRNVVIDQARARAARPPSSRVAPEDQTERPGPGPSAIDSVLLRSVLVDALARVSDEQRAVVVRAVVHDRAYADVAAELRVPVGTVKSRVFYGLRVMREMLDRRELAA